MDEPPNKENKAATPPKREIGNAGLFADDIIFSDTEKILFEEDLHNKPDSDRKTMMDGNPENRYSANRKLNEGGMKTIWEVDDHRTARKVAMALIQSSKIASEDDIDSFLYEARLTANLQHPNIIPIYDIALDENGNPYFTMKALRGETLGEIIRKLKSGNADYLERYTRTRMLSIFLKVCNAVDYAHTKGVIHLDLKPSNINIGDFGEVHVLDWGLSTLITHLNEYDGEPVSWHSMDDVSLEDGQTLTRYLERSAKRRECKNIVGGTPGYMSPEQAQGVPSDIDFQTDVYMLGSVLYEILTYTCPVTGETVKDVLNKTVRGEIIPPGKRAPGNRIPPALAATAMKAMAVDPADRYPNVAALICDIHNYQDGFATSAENPTFLTHASLLVKRHKLAVSLLAGTGLIITTVLIQSFSSIRESGQIAVDALAKLKEKNEYIEATARKVAPDYLYLMREQEEKFKFAQAEQSLNTGLTFAPDLVDGWMAKGKILLCRQDFKAAWNELSRHLDNPLIQNSTLLKLAEKYKDSKILTDKQIPDFVRDLIAYDLNELLPRFLFNRNQNITNPQSHFESIAEALQILNPQTEKLNFQWQPGGRNRWIIDISRNQNLNDITPLCGLNILMLNAGNIGTPDLSLLTQTHMVELRLAGTDINHLSQLNQMKKLQLLDLKGTRVRNLTDILNYPDLVSLDISDIEELKIPPQLIWSTKLKILTVSGNLRNDPTLKALSRRGVIIIYAEN